MMTKVEVHDNGYEMWVRGEPTIGGIVPDPWTVREVIFEAPKGTPDSELETEAEKYLKACFPQGERARVFEDEEDDGDGLGELRVLRIFVE
jgi:hypothetical protein